MSLLYRTLFSTAYFGLFRVSELTLSKHQVKARDVHIGINKDKILFILHSSKTHVKSMPPQMIKIKSTNHKKPNQNREDMNFCPYQLLRQYSQARGGYASDNEAFFIFRDRKLVTAYQFWTNLKMILRISGFQADFYGTHSLRSGRSCDLHNLGLSVETIKKLGRWKSNAVFCYLKI